MFARFVHVSLLILLTTAIHGVATAVIGRWSDRVRAGGHELVRLVYVPALVLALLLVSLFEASLWALYYVVTNQLSSFSEALYFSLITMTTVGYGDVTLTGAGRTTSGMQAALGIVLFGWTTAIIFMAVQAVQRASSRERESRPERADTP